jgi:molybdopterin molybdotransferase
MKPCAADLRWPALDLVGATAQSPLPLTDPVKVEPGMPLPMGTDAVLPEEGVEDAGSAVAAIRQVSPGKGVRRAGHDGRAGDVLLHAGSRAGHRQVMAAELAGINDLSVRRPRVRVELPDPVLARFAAGWACALGASEADGSADLIVRVTPDHRPRLGLIPADTAWLAREGEALVVTTPARFDGMLSALLALGLPALAALSGASLRTNSRPVTRNLPSSVGMSELVLLRGEGCAWAPAPAGLISLSGLAGAEAFAILAAGSEGLSAGSALAATPLDVPFE